MKSPSVGPAGPDFTCKEKENGMLISNVIPLLSQFDTNRVILQLLFLTFLDSYSVFHASPVPNPLSLISPLSFFRPSSFVSLLPPHTGTLRHLFFKTADCFSGDWNSSLTVPKFNFSTTGDSSEVTSSKTRKAFILLCCLNVISSFIATYFMFVLQFLCHQLNMGPYFSLIFSWMETMLTAHEHFPLNVSS